LAYYKALDGGDRGIDGDFPVVFSLEKPKVKLLPFKGPSGEEENPSDYQVILLVFINHFLIVPLSIL
jgi:hypothetical protein